MPERNITAIVKGIAVELEVSPSSQQTNAKFNCFTNELYYVLHEVQSVAAVVLVLGSIVCLRLILKRKSAVQLRVCVSMIASPVHRT